MRNDFCAFILTHGRPDKVLTYETLRRHGYTGKIFIVIDDEDDQEDNYRSRYGDEVLQFSKEKIAGTFDEGDNFNDRRVIIYARNACWDLAREQGYKYFVQLDDDYTGAFFRLDGSGNYSKGISVKQFDEIFESLVTFLAATPFLSVAMAQGGDLIGGRVWLEKHRVIRKAMNTFVCETDRRFEFFGRVNEDVNVYTALQRRGGAFLTFLNAHINQLMSQSNPGGMTEMYLDGGTYVKSFYSVMYAPSCVKIGMMPSIYNRIHHRISWNNTAPKIIEERFKK